MLFMLDPPPEIKITIFFMRDETDGWDLEIKTKFQGFKACSSVTWRVLFF